MESAQITIALVAGAEEAEPITVLDCANTTPAACMLHARTDTDTRHP